MKKFIPIWPSNKVTIADFTIQDFSKSWDYLNVSVKFHLKLNVILIDFGVLSQLIPEKAHRIQY